MIESKGVDSSLYCVSRFSIAALCLAPFAISSARRVGLDKETLRGAAACGSWVAFGTYILGPARCTLYNSCELERILIIVLFRFIPL